MGNRWETVSDFIFLGSKITADGNCSHEIKGQLLLGRKVMTNLDSILKSRDITLPIKVCLVCCLLSPPHLQHWTRTAESFTLPKKVHLVKAMVFPVVMYGCESLTVKKAERRRIDAF